MTPRVITGVIFLPIILQNMTAAIVLAAVAARHGPVIAAGDGLPYWLR